jgi:hypothetical protein
MQGHQHASCTRCAAAAAAATARSQQRLIVLPRHSQCMMHWATLPAVQKQQRHTAVGQTATS